MSTSFNHCKKIKVETRQVIPQTVGCKARARFADPKN